MRIGLYVTTRGGGDVDAIMARFERAESGEFHTAWVGHADDHDALTLLALAGRATHRIELGSWVVPTPPRHPAALAQQALTTQAACGGRLVLGLGVSHAAVIQKRLGLDASRPLRDLREYLAVLRPLLEGKEVAHRGQVYRVRARLETGGTPPPPILVAALGPHMLDLAGREADGAAIWLGGPSYLEHVAVPHLLDGARLAARPRPRLACGLPVAVCDDREAGRNAVEAIVGPSARLPAYRRVLEREGVASPADVALLGSEEEVEKQLLDLAALGATDFNAFVVPVAEEPDSTPRTLSLLRAWRP